MRFASGLLAGKISRGWGAWFVGRKSSGAWSGLTRILMDAAPQLACDLLEIDTPAAGTMPAPQRSWLVRGGSGSCNRKLVTLLWHPCESFVGSPEEHFW